MGPINQNICDRAHVYIYRLSITNPKYEIQNAPKSETLSTDMGKVLYLPSCDRSLSNFRHTKNIVQNYCQL
jgi:hypothetical protein